MTSAAGVTYTFDGAGERVKDSSPRLYWYGVDGSVLAETDTSGNTVNTVGLTLSTGSMINSAEHQDLPGTTLGMASYLKAPAELAARSAAWAWAKWIPFAGAAMDVYSAYRDARQTGRDYSSCMAGH